MNTEDRFTPARPDCPYPQRWHSADSDSTELEVSHLVAAFVRALQPNLVVETGTAWGQTAELIGQALKANGQGRLITLEPDPARAEHSRNRCAGLPVEVLQQSSLDWAPDGPIDFAAKTGRLLGTIRAALAGMEKTEFLERSQGAREEMRRQGKCPSAPMTWPKGVAYDKVRGWYYLPEITQVRKCFDLFLAGEQNFAASDLILDFTEAVN